MGCCQLWVVVEAVSVDEINQEEEKRGKKEPRTVPLGLCSPLYKARRRDPDMPISRVVVVGLILGIRRGLACRCFRKATGYVNARWCRWGRRGCSWAMYGAVAGALDRELLASWPHEKEKHGAPQP